MSDDRLPTTQAGQITKRKFKGRAQWGRICARCRSMHIKCDGLSPCQRCARKGVPCSLTLALLNVPMLFRGNRVVYDHIADVQTWKVAMPERMLLMDFIFPAAQTDDTILNAVICYTMVRHLPLADALRFAVPPQAIEHYMESVKKPPKDMSLLILSTFLYIEIESGLAHLQNLENLYRSAFAIIHAHRSLLKENRNPGLCLCIRQLIEDLFIHPINPACIPQEHWQSTVVFMLGMAAEMKELEEQLTLVLHIEVANLMYDMNRSSDPAIEYRIKNWNRRYRNLPKNLKVAPKTAARSDNALYVMAYQFDHYKFVWNSYCWHIRGSKEHKESVLNETTNELANMEKWREKVGTRSLRALECSLIPNSLILVYHSRDDEVASQVFEVLELYKQNIPYYDKVIDYFKELVRTPFGKPTSLELEAFGEDQRPMLQPWQYEALMPYLIKSGS